MNSSINVIRLTLLLGLSIGLFSLSSRAQNADDSLVTPIGYPAEESICVNGKTYTGCCSGNGGVAKITDEVLVCVNGNQSKTCKGEPEVNLGGCCSGKDGVDYANPDRSVVCKDGEKSPTCSLRKCSTATES